MVLVKAKGDPEIKTHNAAFPDFHHETSVIQEPRSSSEMGRQRSPEGFPFKGTHGVDGMRETGLVSTPGVGQEQAKVT